MRKHEKGIYERFIKRPQDFCCAFLALIVLSPILVVIAVLVGIKLGTPIIFTQERPGLHGKIFKLYKFRTMTNEVDEEGNLLPDEKRLTFFGKKLRDTSLDELPALINILKGEMAIVGPRPLLVKYLPLYNEYQSRRHEVRPGFTGYAQVNGRNAISWEKKFDLDVEYVDNITFINDWKIIFKTILTVLNRNGIHSETSVTMEEFKGTNKGIYGEAVKKVFKKKVLMIASVPSMIGQFNIENIKLLQKMGYKVEVACNFDDTSIWTSERIVELKRYFEDNNIKYFNVMFSRSAFDIKAHLKSYKQVKNILRQNEKYEFIHCHTPIVGAIVRIVARTECIKVTYTAHGFHFYKNAPIKNWILFYPVEWMCSWLTNVLVTINKEDFERAKTYFHARKIKYVPGVGIDANVFCKAEVDCDRIRSELGIPVNAIVLISVGELNYNKNHSTVIRALSKLQLDNVHYIIAGQGELEQELVELSRKLSVSSKVHLLGYRTDIIQLLKAADIFVLPSIREGLNVSLMEAKASGLPCIASKIRGNVDLIQDSINGILVDSQNVCEYAEAIKRLIDSEDLRIAMGEINKHQAVEYDIKNINKRMEKVYMASF